MLIDDLTVGCAVRSKRNFPSINVKEGEIGWVYETYQLGSHRGVSVIFKNGGYDGFGEDTIEDFLEDMDVFDSKHSSYVFKNVYKLVEDYRKNLWSFEL